MRILNYCNHKNQKGDLLSKVCNVCRCIHWKICWCLCAFGHRGHHSGLLWTVGQLFLSLVSVLMSAPLRSLVLLARCCSSSSLDTILTLVIRLMMAVWSAAFMILLELSVVEMFGEEWAEHAALRDASVDSDCGGCGRTCSSILLPHSKQLKSTFFWILVIL